MQRKPSDEEKERSLNTINEEIEGLRQRLIELEKLKDETIALWLRKKKIILVIDDEADMCAVLKEYIELRRPQYKVYMAFDGEEGENQISLLEPDLIILDMNLPKKGGIHIYKDISMNKQGRPPMKVLVFTVREELGDFFDSIDVDGFIHKPVEMKQVLQEVDRVLASAARVVVFLMDNPQKEHVKGLKDTLKKEGYRVITIDSLNSFIKEAEAHIPDYIIMEYEQAGALTKKEFVEKMTEVQNMLRGKAWPAEVKPSLLIYSYNELSSDYKDECRALGADFYFGKPKDYAAVIDVIKEIQVERGRMLEELRLQEEIKRAKMKLDNEPKDPPGISDFNYFNR